MRAVVVVVLVVLALSLSLCHAGNTNNGNNTGSGNNTVTVNGTYVDCNCQSSTMCCDSYGSCGNSEAYCGAQCVSGPCYGSRAPRCNLTTPCDASSAQYPCCSMDGLCGNGASCGPVCIGGACTGTPAQPPPTKFTCAGPSECLSVWGYCGTSVDFCGLNCAYGNCTAGYIYPPGAACSPANLCPSNADGQDQCCGHSGDCGTTAATCGPTCIAGPCTGSPAASCSASNPCTGAGECCSNDGYCGITSSFCGSTYCDSSVANNPCWEINQQCSSSAPCEDPTACCNIFLMCGNTSVACGAECVNGPCAGTPVTPCTASNTCPDDPLQCCAYTATAENFCGYGDDYCGLKCLGGNCEATPASVGMCDANHNCNQTVELAYCCSVFNYCGTSSQYCGGDCIGNCPNYTVNADYPGPCQNGSCLQYTNGSNMCCSYFNWCGISYCSAQNTSNVTVSMNKTANNNPSLDLTPTGNQGSTTIDFGITFSIVVKNITEFNTDGGIVSTMVVDATLLTVTATVTETVTYHHASGVLPNHARLNISIGAYGTATSIPFGSRTVNVPSQGVKYNLRIDSWPFNAPHNYLRLVMVIVSNNPSSESLTTNSDSASNLDLQWLELSALGINDKIGVLSSSFVDIALVDGLEYPIKFNYYPVEEGNEIYAWVPIFNNFIIIDPTYSVILKDEDLNQQGKGGSPNMTGAIIGITVPVVVIGAIALSVMLYFRWKRNLDLDARIDGRAMEARPASDSVSNVSDTSSEVGGTKRLM